MDMVLDQDLVLDLELQNQADLVEVQEHQVRLVMEVGTTQELLDLEVEVPRVVMEVETT